MVSNITGSQSIAVYCFELSEMRFTKLFSLLNKQTMKNVKNWSAHYKLSFFSHGAYQKKLY